jgi:hypothetical protein
MGLVRKRKDPPGDPWQQALGRHIADEPNQPMPGSDPTEPSGRRRLSTVDPASGLGLDAVFLPADQARDKESHDDTEHAPAGG